MTDQNAVKKEPAAGGRNWRFRTLRRVRGLPIHVRLTVGVLLILGGLMWFLPVVGLWMLPLGIIVLAFDVPPVRRWLKRWTNNRRARARAKASRAGAGTDI